MQNIFDYYEFTDFFDDKSGAFTNEICYTSINEQHFLIFERIEESYNLYVSRYGSKKEIGEKAPEIVELLVTNYDKSIPKHRLVMRSYIE